MKIGIDCRLWSETGVGRYIRNLVINLSNIDKKNNYVLFVRSTDEKRVRQQVSSDNFSFVIADIPWHGVREQVDLPKILKKYDLDMVHFPYFSVPLFYNRPFVVTVHDLIINSFSTGRASTLPLPIYLAKRIGYHTVLKLATTRAKKIITPSNAVKNDLLTKYKSIEPSKVDVIYEGGFGEKIKEEALKTEIEGRYILRVGNLYPHKNVEGLLLAFKDFIYDDYDNHDVKLVLVGKKDYFYSRIKRMVFNMNIESNVYFVENPKDEVLISLYKNAQATIVPSFMEGFSLTAVEALSCGSLVVASDIPVHREICQDAAIYCNPRDLNDIKQKINFALSLDDLSRKELIEQGKKQARKYSWQEMAKETLRVYQSLK